MQCWQDDGAIVIPAQAIVVPCVCGEHCSCPSGHVGTLALAKVLQQCGDVVPFRGVSKTMG